MKCLKNILSNLWLNFRGSYGSVPNKFRVTIPREINGAIPWRITEAVKTPGGFIVSFS